MRTLITILTVIILNSCEQKQDKNNYENFKTFNIEFAEIDIALPSTFSISNSDELIENFNNIDRPKEFLEARIEEIRALENSPMGYKYLVDTTNFSTHIVFYGGEHVYITKSLARQYFVMLENRFKKEWTPMGMNFKRLESRFFSGKNVQMIKVKYKQKFENYTSFSTQYVISTNHKTFSMVVNSQTTEDFEEQVKTIRLKK